MITDDDFMKELERDYPNENWDNIPDPSTLPSVYKIYGQKQVITKSLISGKTTKRLEHFEIGVEFKTKEEAENCIKENTESWSKVHFSDDSLTWRRNLVWSGPHLMDSIKIQEKKPSDAVAMSTIAQFRKQILAGEKVFPIYLP